MGGLASSEKAMSRHELTFSFLRTLPRPVGLLAD
jgi:hypothetical protein